MKREILCIRDTHAGVDSGSLLELLNDGYVLDPMFRSRPIVTDNFVIYHLVKYDEGEQPQTIEEPRKRICSIKSVRIDEADPYLAEGYEMLQSYASTVTLVKYEEVKKDV